MKFVFLDFDGVLNYLSMEGIGPRGLKVAPECMDQLNILCRHSGAYLVISSSWRHGLTPIELQGMLFTSGLSLMTLVMGKTPNYGRERGHEIAWWLEATNLYVDGIVVLDDDSDMVMMKPWLVQTDPHYGLVPKDVDKALKILSKPFDLGMLKR